MRRADRYRMGLEVLQCRLEAENNFDQNILDREAEEGSRMLLSEPYKEKLKEKIRERTGYLRWVEYLLGEGSPTVIEDAFKSFKG